jgi:hypothetical protein
MKIAVLTSLFGSKSDIRSLTDEELAYDVDYFAFLDRDHPSSNGWKQIICPEFTSHSMWQYRRNAKIYKVLPSLFLPDYDIYVWIDSGHLIIKDPHAICKEHLRDNDIAVFDHPDRNCGYEEAQVVADMGIEDPEIISRQLQHFQSTGFPQNMGLYEMSCFIRRNNEATNRLGLMWWEIICRFSSRDQTTFPYVVWRMGEEISLSILPGYANRSLLNWHENGNEFFLFGQQPSFNKKY